MYRGSRSTTTSQLRERVCVCVCVGNKHVLCVCAGLLVHIFVCVGVFVCPSLCSERAWVRPALNAISIARNFEIRGLSSAITCKSLPYSRLDNWSLTCSDYLPLVSSGGGIGRWLNRNRPVW